MPYSSNVRRFVRGEKNWLRGVFRADARRMIQEPVGGSEESDKRVPMVAHIATRSLGALCQKGEASEQEANVGFHLLQLRNTEGR